MLTSLLGSTLYSLSSLFTTQLLFRGKAKHPFACLYNRVSFNFLTHHKKEESMWTMGYNDGGEFNIPTDSFNGRRLRPLIPRPNNTTPTNTITTPNCPGRLHGTDFFSLNNHLAAMGGCDQGKRELSQAGVVVSSSRWNPTPEQLRTLEELYRRGTRTPSADQIQHITAQLRRYGKIEGKNVFYWFQNHKARERQKRRRQMEYSGPDHPLVQPQVFERKDSSSAGGSRTGFEGEQTKNWVRSTNFSTLAEESVTTSRGAGIAECCRVDGWIQLEEGELEHRRSCFIERNGTWQMKQLSRPSPSHHHHLINPTTCCCSAATPPTTTSCTPAAAAATNGTGIATTTTSTSASKLPSATTKRTMDPTNQLIKGRHDLNIFIAPYRTTGDAALINHLRHSAINEEEEEEDDQEDQDDGTFDPFGESQTLQLFPLRSCGNTNSDIIINQKLDFTDASSVAAMNNNANLLMSSTSSSSSTSPCPFFEFLPLKN